MDIVICHCGKLPIACQCPECKYCQNPKCNHVDNHSAYCSYYEKGGSKVKGIALEDCYCSCGECNGHDKCSECGFCTAKEGHKATYKGYTTYNIHISGMNTCSHYDPTEKYLDKPSTSTLGH